MKNYIIAALILALGGTFYYYEVVLDVSSEDQMEEEQEVDALREKLDEFKKSSTKESDGSEGVDQEESEEVEEEEVEEEEPEEEVVVEEESDDYDGASFITLTTPSNNEALESLPIIFSGIVSPDTNKVVVSAEGGEGDSAYSDVYTLNDFNVGDESFTYRAKPDWDNLLNGLNDYQFTAYFTDGSEANAYISIIYQES
jgi:hypothetical protein